MRGLILRSTPTKGDSHVSHDAPFNHHPSHHNLSLNNFLEVGT